MCISLGDKNHLFKTYASTAADIGDPNQWFHGEHHTGFKLICGSSRQGFPHIGRLVCTGTDTMTNKQIQEMVGKVVLVSFGQHGIPYLNVRLTGPHGRDPGLERFVHCGMDFLLAARRLAAHRGARHVTEVAVRSCTDIDKYNIAVPDNFVAALSVGR